MVKENNERIMITLSKKQVKWLKKFCKEHNFTISKFICYLLSKKTEEMLLYIKAKVNPEKAQESLEEIIRIAKTPWLDIDE